MYGNNYGGGYGQPPQQQWNQPPQQGYGAPPQQQYGGGAYPGPGMQGSYGGNTYGAPPQQGYGAPPNQYGAPPANQYGAPPPQQNYGAPPANQYGAPPPAANTYGAPPASQYGAPPANQYGAPPASQYGAPPAQQNTYGAPPPQQQYGAPPQQSWGAPAQPAPGFGPRYLGVPIPAPPPAPPLTQLQGYNPNFDADRIRKATKGFGTDERTLIDVLAPLDAFQVDLLSRTYESTVGRSLKVTLEKELSGWFEYIMVLKSLGPLGGDVYLLNRACKGMGTHEDLLTEILVGRSNAELHLLKEAYRRTYNKDLDAVVRGELSMKTERMFNMVLACSRDESPFVNQQQVQQDVETLYRAGPGKIGTDEIAICGILMQRSDAHLQAIAQAFPNRHRMSLSHMIESEFSGHMKDALLHVARGAENDGQGVYRDVLLLEAAMAGLGTKDERLCYRICRAHWNRPRFAAIKNQYQALYRKSLRRRVEGETSGKYEKALVGIIEQN